jgi:hypothetical protein
VKPAASTRTRHTWRAVVTTYATSSLLSEKYVPPQMSVNGFCRVSRLRLDVLRSAPMVLSVVGSISRSLNPSSPPHNPTMRPCESKAMVAHSETPYDAERTLRFLPSGPLTP